MNFSFLKQKQDRNSIIRRGETGLTTVHLMSQRTEVCDIFVLLKFYPSRLQRRCLKMFFLLSDFTAFGYATWHIHNLRYSHAS